MGLNMLVLLLEPVGFRLGLSVLQQTGVPRVLPCASAPGVCSSHGAHQGCAGSKRSQSCSVFGRDAAGLWLSSWFCFVSAGAGASP